MKRSERKWVHKQYSGMKGSLLRQVNGPVTDGVTNTDMDLDIGNGRVR